MKKPLLNEFERWVLINEPNSLFGTRLELYLESTKLKRCLKMEYKEFFKKN